MRLRRRRSGIGGEQNRHQGEERNNEGGNDDSEILASAATQEPFQRDGVRSRPRGADAGARQHYEIHQLSPAEALLLLNLAFPSLPWQEAVTASQSCPEATLQRRRCANAVAGLRAREGIGTCLDLALFLRCWLLFAL